MKHWPDEMNFIVLVEQLRQLMLLAFAVVLHNMCMCQEAFVHLHLSNNCIQSGAPLTPLQLNALQPLSSICSALVAVYSCQTQQYAIIRHARHKQQIIQTICIAL